MPLFIDTGFSSARGAHHDDESCLMVVPTVDTDTGHGALLIVADGIAERPAPESASKDTLKAFGGHYYAAPENWGLKHVLQESAAAANQALLRSGERSRAASFAALVLRRRRWAVIYAGNTRVWLRRGNELKLLTRDHVTPRVGRPPQVDRACGLAPRLEADFVSGEIAEGDVFVITNESAHNSLTSPAILACARTDASARQIATTVADKAMKAGGANACACVIRVEQVPAESREDLEEDIAALPAIAAPEVGDSIDDFRIERLIHKSSRYRLYKALDTQNQKIVALKFPNPRDADDPAFAETFLREEWISRRIVSTHLVRTLPLKKGRRTTLYSVMEYPGGENLAKKLARHDVLSLDDASQIGAQLLEALTQLHAQAIVHNDIRPQNIVLEKRTGNLMLLGLGATTPSPSETPGSKRDPSSRRANFIAPELFNGKSEPTARSDIYSAGVMLYRMLTGTYPYGKNNTADQPPRGTYVPATQHRTDIPEPIDSVLRTACALDPADRFESAQTFAEALDSALARTLSGAAAPSTRRVGGFRWDVAAIAGLVVLFVVYLVFTFRR
jgi:serine/threonine protein phosphatase PrpC